MRNAATPTRPRRVRALAAAACVAPLLSLSACGFDAATNQVYQPAEGGDAREAPVLVLNAVVVSDGQGSGELSGVLSNTRAKADRLTEVSGTVSGGQVAGGKVAPEVGLQVQQSKPVTVPGLQNVDLSSAHITLTSPRLVAGESTSLTFTFAGAGQVRLSVPVVSKDLYDTGSSHG